MAEKKNPLGPTGEIVRENVSRLRGRTQYKELSERLASLGRPIPPLGLRRIEAGERRVDADDLMALSVALGVPPNSLLLPHLEPETGPLATGADKATFEALWNWADGRTPLHGENESEAERTARREMARPHFAGLKAAGMEELMRRAEALAHDIATLTDVATETGEASRRGDD